MYLIKTFIIVIIYSGLFCAAVFMYVLCLLLPITLWDVFIVFVLEMRHLTLRLRSLPEDTQLLGDRHGNATGLAGFKPVPSHRPSCFWTCFWDTFQPNTPNQHTYSRPLSSPCARPRPCIQLSISLRLSPCTCILKPKCFCQWQLDAVMCRNRC